MDKEFYALDEILGRGAHTPQFSLEQHMPQPSVFDVPHNDINLVVRVSILAVLILLSLLVIGAAAGGANGASPSVDRPGTTHPYSPGNTPNPPVEP